MNSKKLSKHQENILTLTYNNNGISEQAREVLGLHGKTLAALTPYVNMVDGQWWRVNDAGIAYLRERGLIADDAQPTNEPTQPDTRILGTLDGQVVTGQDWKDAAERLRQQKAQSKAREERLRARFQEMETAKADTPAQPADAQAQAESDDAPVDNVKAYLDSKTLPELRVLYDEQATLVYNLVMADIAKQTEIARLQTDLAAAQQIIVKAGADMEALRRLLRIACEAYRSQLDPEHIAHKHTNWRSLLEDTEHALTVVQS